MSESIKENKPDVRVKILNVKIDESTMEKWYEVTLDDQVYRVVETFIESECSWSKNPDKKEWTGGFVYVFDEDENMMMPDGTYYNIADEILYYIHQD